MEARSVNASFTSNDSEALGEAWRRADSGYVRRVDPEVCAPPYARQSS